MKFEQIINDVLLHEGGYVDDPLDKGGETNFGISKRWYPHIDIKNLTKNDAVNIYYNDYWIPSKASELPGHLRSTYFDMVVNMGQTTAIRIMQEAINSVQATRIDEDGLIGPETINSANKLSKKRLQAYRCHFYSKIVIAEPTQKRFYYGWFKRATSV